MLLSGWCDILRDHEVGLGTVPARKPGVGLAEGVSAGGERYSGRRRPSPTRQVPTQRGTFLDLLLTDATVLAAVTSESSSSEAGSRSGKRKAEADSLQGGKYTSQRPDCRIFPWIGKLDDLTGVNVPPPRIWPPARRERRKEGGGNRPAKRAKGEGLPQAWQCSPENGASARSYSVKLPERTSTRVAADDFPGPICIERLRKSLWEVHDREKKWMLDQQKYKWAATDAVKDRHARRRQAARLGTLMGADDVERALKISLPDWERGYSSLVEGILELLVSRTASHLAGVWEMELVFPR